MSSETPSDFDSRDVFASPPFVTVEGVVNVRTLGGYSIPGQAPRSQLKPLHVFRSGDLSGITDHGKAQLLVLGITTIFDTRLRDRDRTLPISVAGHRRGTVC
ncbi:hypothetical protein FPV67DRAFT_988417 [Lyophyllum atratum]|nr:hypothetical protein FPV67DRAFT_988417 [Lyophyllum atratum]